MKPLLFLLFLCAAITVSAAEPVLRIGILSDSHLDYSTPDTENTFSALNHLAGKKIDVLVHAGDFCNGQPELLSRFIEEFNKAFPGKKPKTLYVLGNHDIMPEAAIASGKTADLAGAGVNFRRYLGVKTLYPVLTVKGYTFIGFPFSHYGTDDLRRKIYELTDVALKRHPENPVFVVSHISPPDTVWYMSEYRGEVYSYGYTSDILFRAPRFINITGHSHADLTDDRNFWQGQCTVLNAGCSIHQFLLAEVYPQEIVIRRYYSADGKEICPDSPWKIALPVKKIQPERFGRIWKAAPVFADAPGLRVNVGTSPEHELVLSFPIPAGDDQALTYTADFYSDGKPVQTRSFCRKIWNSTDAARREIEWKIPGAILQKAGKYTVKLSAQNGGGLISNPLSADFRMPENKAVCIYQEPLTERERAESLDIRGNAFRLPVRGKGFVIPPRNNLEIHFPGETVSRMKGKKGYVLLTVETDRCMRQNFKISAGKTFVSESIPVSTPFPMDYLCRFECPDTCSDPYFTIRNFWGEGTVCIRDLRIFVH